MPRAPLLALLLWTALAPPSTSVAEELSQAAAETRLAALREEIRALQHTLGANRQSYSEEQARLRELDLHVQTAALGLREVQQRIDEQRDELRRLRDDRDDYLTQLEERRDALSQQVVAAYRMGRESRLKLLLNQDSPARIGRMLVYYDYYNGAQIDRIRELRTALETLDRLQAAIDQALDRLAVERLGREKALAELQGSRNQRQQLVSALQRQIVDDEARLEELSRNQADLEALVERLADALSDIPTDLGQYHHPRELRGQLSMPIEGPVRHAFGQARSGGMSWQGWLIAAPSGAEVRTVAYGRVAYADWLRGYGLMIIIDHGEGFMSLYGNNESLLFEPGDWVQPGEVIATVGDNGGNEQGLYFEIRNEGRAIDPAGWIRRR